MLPMVSESNYPKAAILSAQGVDHGAMSRALREFLEAAGLPEAAAGEAPGKTAKAWSDHLLVGYGRDPVEVLRPTWSAGGSEIVTMRRIPFVSICAHHLLPFFGHAHLAYLPNGQITGLSRLEDLVACLSRRLQIQERLTEEIATTLMQGVDAAGAACLIEARHLCVFARGRAQSDSSTQTLWFCGQFRQDPDLRGRFLQLALRASEG